MVVACYNYNRVDCKVNYNIIDKQFNKTRTQRIIKQHKNFNNNHNEKIGEKCFTKCISKPGSSLDNSEQKCLAMCMDRYMDSWNLVSRTYSARLQRERNRLDYLIWFVLPIMESMLSKNIRCLKDEVFLFRRKTSQFPLLK
ncbi:Mitochondrial import inner membrane translocase subunit Tim13-B [Armadillidium vulgare]|nr:Mitochondrial import inner membrane translocase subunit Tim13-B [Armadillidium vulgare]